MYHQKRICISVLLLFCLNQISAIQIPCTSDSDCSGGQGVCTAIGTSSYCSCLSGFGGASCDERPDSTCAGSFGAVSATASSLQTSSSLSYQYPNLTLSVTANLEESKYVFPADNNTLNLAPYSEELSIIFGNGSFPECDFPNNNTDWRDLAAASGDCNDQYSLTLAFTDAKSKCGFADNNGDRVFEQVIHINRKYKLQTLRGQAVSRIDTSVRTLRLIFPHEVSVSTSSVQVVGSPSLLAAITLIDFDPSPELWTVQATTSIQSPFKLTNPIVTASSGDISTHSRFQTGSEFVSVVSGCGNNTQDCYQKVSLGFVAGTATDACYGLTGSVTVRLNVTCSESNATACPLLGGETVEVILTLSTSDACPVTEEIQFTTASLASYSNAGASNSRSSFMTNQIAYFGANVQAADTLITDRRVKNNSVCFKIGAAACQPVVFTEISAAGGKDPVFSVDFSDGANAGVFGFLDSASASSQLFSVYATIEADFSGVSKSMSLKKQQVAQGSREVELSTTVKLESFLNSDAVTAAPSMIIMIALVVIGMLL